MVLIFAGTTEGRELAELFEKSAVQAHVCVATEYGAQMLDTSDYITVHTGRLDENGMIALMHDIDCDIVVDATHPYAVEATATIMASSSKAGVKYMRLLRNCEQLPELEGVYYYDDAARCAEALCDFPGNILLTTGSKELAKYAAFPQVQERLFARVIPGIESLELCYAAGLKGNQIIAMQGPFSREMNEAILREYNVSHMVTKESGTNGGINEKLEAARAAGVTVHVIRRPEDAGLRNGDVVATSGILAQDNVPGNSAIGMTKGDLINKLQEVLGVTFVKGNIHVTLAGIGPGSSKMMTEDVKLAIADADVIFGAKRMLESVDCRCAKYPYYQSEQIIPVLDDMVQSSYMDIKAVVLFSGDTGFYSGCRKMCEALEHCDRCEVQVLPGISSIAMLAARLGTDWNEGKIISLHGVEMERWIPEIIDSVKHNEKTFFIASGVSDIKVLGRILDEVDGEYTVYLGYQLSYPQEKVLVLSATECSDVEAEGLYTGLILAKEPKPRYLVPALEDDFFIRDQVPMTKESVRKLSVCQMNIKENDVVYDIGSGSGSIAVQVGALSPTVKVYALECDHKAVELTSQNVSKASLRNVAVIETMAPDGIDQLPAADVAFIGGSKGRIDEILRTLSEKNPAMRVVINAVSLETISQLQQILPKMTIKNLVVEQVAVSRVKQLGDYHMLSANNPVYVYSFDFASECN